jgi:hypothetical protein
MVLFFFKRVRQGAYAPHLEELDYACAAIILTTASGRKTPVPNPALVESKLPNRSGM